MATNKQLDQQGELAKKMYKTMTDSSKHYNERRKEQTEDLRGALTPVWQALGAGKVVNGCANKLSWAQWANPKAKHPERWFYAVMNDETELKSVQSEKTVTVKPGMILLIEGVRYRLPSKIVERHDKTSVTLTGVKVVLRKLNKREECPECGYTLDVKNGKFGQHTHMPGPRYRQQCEMSNQPVEVNERGKVVNISKAKAA